MFVRISFSLCLRTVLRNATHVDGEEEEEHEEDEGEQRPPYSINCSRDRAMYKFMLGSRRGRVHERSPPLGSCRDRDQFGCKMHRNIGFVHIYFLNG